MLAEKDEGINSAYKRLRVISQDDDKRKDYEARMKAIRDYNQGMIEAEERGIEKGREKGREEGREEAFFDIARKMLSAGMDIKMIASMTNLSENQIQTLK